MNRLVTEIDWRKRFIDPIGLTYTPFAQLRGDIYALSDYVDPQDPQGPTQNTSLARGMALAGVTVSYPWVANGSYGSHVIEPIGQIIARQATINQNALPDEDAKSLVFDDTNLFDLNKFSGYDRIETGTRANVGLQYTFQANYGGYCPYPRRRELPTCRRQRVCGSRPRRQWQSGIHARQRPADQSLRLRARRLPPTLHGLQLISQSRFDEANFALEREDAGSQVTIGPFTGSTIYSYLSSDPANGILPRSRRSPVQSASSSPTAGASRPACATTSTPTSSLPTWSRCATPTSASCSLRRTRTTYYHNPTIVDGQTLMVRFELKHLGSYGYSTNVLEHAVQRADSRAAAKH